MAPFRLADRTHTPLLPSPAGKYSALYLGYTSRINLKIQLAFSIPLLFIRNILSIKKEFRYKTRIEQTNGFMDVGY
jgi:hypothetical protein